MERTLCLGAVAVPPLGITSVTKHALSHDFFDSMTSALHVGTKDAKDLDNSCELYQSLPGFSFFSWNNPLNKPRTAGVFLCYNISHQSNAVRSCEVALNI